MKRLNLRVGLVTAGLALAALPAFAQRPSQSGSSPASERPTAVERPGTSGGPSGGGGSAATSSGGSGGSGMSSSSPSGGAGTTGVSGGSSTAYRAEAPQHRGGSGGGGQHASSGGQHTASSQGEHATPRGSNTSNASGTGRVSSSNSNGTNNAAPANGARDTRAIPSWARPRGDRSGTGTAVTRTLPRLDNRGVIVYDPYTGGIFGGYSPAGYYSYLNYPYYMDPWLDPRYPYMGNPFALGYGFGLGFPMMYDPYMGGGDSYYPAYQQPQEQGDEGHLRLKVKPRDAKVYIDGSFVGTVDDMDGMFQKFPLMAGRHHVEIKADGYQTEAFDAMIPARDTITFQGQLKKIQ